MNYDEGLAEHPNKHPTQPVRSWNRAGPTVRLAWTVWIILLLVMSLRGLLRLRTNSVYPIFAQAARHFLAEADLYRTAGDPYRYSPLVAALFVPFSACPDALGGVLWRLLNAAVYLAGLTWCCRIVLPRFRSASQQALLFLLIVPLSVGSLNNAQSNPLILGLLLIGTVAVVRQFWWLAGGCLAGAALFKVYPLALGLLLAALYPRRLGGKLAAALLLGLALPFLLKPAGYVTEQYAGWLHHLQTDDRQRMPVELWYRDVRLLARQAHVAVSSRTYLLIQLAAAGGCVALCLVGRRRGWEQGRLLSWTFTLACGWMTVFGSATESSTYILLAPSLAWSLLDAWQRPTAWWLRIGLLVSFGLFTVSHSAVWFPGGAQRVHPLGLDPLAGLLLLVCVLGREWHRTEAGAPAQTSGAIVPAHAA